MLRTISSRKSYLFLPFLALLYFMIGAHVLHPYFHNHKDFQADAKGEHLHAKIHHHLADSIALPTFNVQHSCLICDFFAANSVLKLTSVPLYLPSSPDAQVDIWYQVSVIPVNPLGFHIRGPPA